jgi:hypothetical protein
MTRSHAISQISQSIRTLARLKDMKEPAARFSLPEQPFDSLLLKLSSLYRRSRQLYLKLGGQFQATLVTSPRTLSSSALLEPKIQYSPIETELIWTATHSKRKEDLLTLRTYCSSLFHEQNHRILWKLLPPPPEKPSGVRRYLNAAESLIVALDMSLGDELGPRLAPHFFQVGAIYDPGTALRINHTTKNQRDYRNYLQAALYATYLNLEFYTRSQASRAIDVLYSNVSSELRKRAIARAYRLDAAFVEKTNPIWQKMHQRRVSQKLQSGRKEDPLSLSENPMDNRLIYLWAERWFDLMDL